MAGLRLGSFRLISYAPAFVAQRLGLFEAEGVSVSYVPHAGHWSELISSLAAGSMDVALGNLWFAMQTWRAPQAVVPIAHCLRQCGSLIVGRSTTSNEFSWADLRDSVLAVQSDVPTPWIALREALRLKRVPLDAGRILVGLSTLDAADALRAGALNFAVLHVDRAEQSDVQERAALADVLGPVPWSVFLARTVDLKTNPDPYRRFQRAVGRALQWMDAQPAAAIWSTIAGSFAGMDPRVATRTIDRYRKMAAWPTHLGVEVEDVERWQEMLLRWGLMIQPVAINDLLRFMPDGRQPGAAR